MNQITIICFLVSLVCIQASFSSHPELKEMRERREAMERDWVSKREQELAM